MYMMLYMMFILTLTQLNMYIEVAKLLTISNYIGSVQDTKLTDLLDFVVLRTIVSVDMLYVYLVFLGNNWLL